MYFIYSIMMFVLLSIASEAMGSLMPTTEGHHVLTVFSYIFFVLSVGFTIVGFFYQLGQHTLYGMLREQLATSEQSLLYEQEEYNQYKADFSEFYNKLYPEYEKELFKEMNPADKSQLQALLIKYPQLQYSAAFKDFADKCNKYLGYITGKKVTVREKQESINKLKINPWLLFKPKGI